MKALRVIALIIITTTNACFHRPPETHYQVTCYSGGQIVLTVQHALEPSAGPSGTWHIVDASGKQRDARADCISIPE